MSAGAFETQKQKWEKPGSRPDRLVFGSGMFYVCSYYLPGYEEGVKPVITIESFHNAEDAIGYIYFSAISGYLRSSGETSGEGPGLRALMENIRGLLESGEDFGAEKAEQVRKDYNSVFGQRNHTMPYIEAWGGMSAVMGSGIIKSVLVNKRVRARNVVLKALVDTRKFDEKKEDHMKLAEKFIRSLW